MVKLFFTSIFYFITFLSFGQDTIQQFFYKDYRCFKEVPQKKANYSKITTLNSEGVISYIFINLKTNSSLSIEKYKNKIPTGIWIYCNENGDTISVNNYVLIVYVDSLIITDTTNQSILRQSKSGIINPAFITYPNDIERYFLDKFEVPDILKELGIYCYTEILITVEADGTVKMSSILKGTNPLIAMAALRTINSIHKCNPATIDDIPVKSNIVLPFRINIE